MSWGHPIWTRFLPSKMVMSLATLGPVGRIRRAPGTWGSLAGLIYQICVFQPLGAWQPWWQAAGVALILFGLWFAVAVCGEAEFRLGRRDPGEVILDEFMAMPLCFLGWQRMLVGPWAHSVWVVLLVGFLLFRLFDITKPLFVGKLQDLPGGWGIVMDDAAAALVTCAVMHGAAWAWIYFHA